MHKISSSSLMLEFKWWAYISHFQARYVSLNSYIGWWIYFLPIIWFNSAFKLINVLFILISLYVIIWSINISHFQCLQIYFIVINKVIMYLYLRNLLKHDSIQLTTILMCCASITIIIGIFR
jgi:hypothetical protein